MKAVFIELPPFQRLREQYFDDDTFQGMQVELMKNPEAGDIIQGTGGLRKFRFGDQRRGKGKRGGLRVIYYWRDTNDQFWLFTVYDKDEAADLTMDQRRVLRDRLQREIKTRSAVV